MTELEFFPEGHTYRLNGRYLPSVTHVLKPLACYETVSKDVLERASEFGTHVHLATELDDQGILDEASLDPALAPYLAAWRVFKRESGFTITSTEERVYHARLGYAGTLDRRATRRYRDALIDIKSGIVPISTGPQTAAYARAVADMGGPRNLLRYCVQLRREGTYRLIPLTDPADWTAFLSCLNVLKWRNRNVP